MPKRDEDEASVGGSSRGSGSSHGSRGSAGGEGAKRTAAESSDDAAELLQSKTGLIQPTFGVLYSTFSAEKYDHLLRFTVARIILEFVQLLLLVLRPEYGFQLDTGLWAWSAIKWVEFADPLTSSSYKFYIVWMYVGVVIILCTFCVAFWVSWCFKNNRFPYIWPVMLLRLVANATVHVFYISCFSVFLVSFNCNWFMEGQGEIMLSDGSAEVVDLRFRLHRFPRIQCLETPQLAHGIVGLVFCFIFACIAYAVTLTDFESNPASRRWMATPHSSVELWALTFKTIMALNMAIFSGQLYIQSVIMCLASLSLCYLYIRWQPYYNEWVNHIRSGLHCMVFWVAVFMAIMKFDHKRDDPGHLKWLTDVMLIGLGPVLVFGALLSFARLRLSMFYILKTIMSAPKGTRTKDLFWFSFPEEVEIASRVLRKWLPEDDEELDPDAVKLADLIIQVGLTHFPTHPKMCLVYARFLISVERNYQMGPSLLQHCTKLEDATLADRFITFCLEQDHKARSKSQAGVGLTDLVGYVEFQRNFRMLARAHRSSLMTLRAFWTYLLRDDVDFKRLLDGFANIEASAKRTDKIFKVLLARYPENDSIYRIYARFLEHVRSDPWTSHRFALSADKIEEDQDKSGGALLETGISVSGLGNLNEKVQAIIVINASGVMLVANKVAQRMFGYKKTELEGKNVSMLMPNPFSSRHSSYLRTHINTGKTRLLGSVRTMLGIHKNQTVFPISLGVTKVSGIGGDSLFMGAISPLKSTPDVVRIWCLPTGTVLSMDDEFFQCFGKNSKDVTGRPFSTLARDPDVILKLLERASQAHADDILKGKIHQKGVFVLHKYLDAVEVDITIGLGGSDTQRLLSFDMRLTHNQGMLMVADERGHLLYMNSEMRQTLGIPDDTNVSKLDMTSLMPPPFSLLHGRWMKEPGASIPKQSCRSGATVVMSGMNGIPLPVRPKISTREVDDTVQHSVKVELSSWSKGLDERQLTLTLDTHGTILATNSALTSLFGFRVNELIGKRVSKVVDVLAQMGDGEMESALALMAAKVNLKPGYSWRIGVHPPLEKPLHELSPMDVLILRRSTTPAVMMLELKVVEEEQLPEIKLHLYKADMLELKVVEEEQLPEIKLHLYKADMLNSILEVDQAGFITKSNLSPLDPTGFLFGCGARSMQRRPIRHYLQLDGKGVDSLLQNDKVKGAMKKGTGTGPKVGPLKFIDGIHADGSSLKLNTLAVTLDGKHIVIKCSFALLEKGDVHLFRETLQESKQARARRMSAFAAHFEEEAKLLAPILEAENADAQVPAKKGVKFAEGVNEEEDEDANSVSDDVASEELMEAEEEDTEQAVASELLESEQNSSDDEEAQAEREAQEALMTTDWRRGRRLKVLYNMLTSQRAKVNQTRYLNSTYAMLAVLVIVHTALFATWTSKVIGLNVNVQDLVGNGNLIFEISSIAINVEKLKNMYDGTFNANLYVKSDHDVQITVNRLENSISQAELLLHGIYLGFNGLRRINDQYGLKALWEGDSLEEEYLVDVRMPYVQDQGSNLWLSGLAYISAARELQHNYVSIAQETNNNLTKDASYVYIRDNGDTLTNSYIKSVSAFLNRDLGSLDQLTRIGWGLMAADLVVCAFVIIFSLILLMGVSHTRHSLMAVFLTIPSGYLRVLAEKQVKMAAEDAEGNEEDEEDEQHQQQHKAATVPTLGGILRPSQEGGSKNDSSKNIVIDVDALATASANALANAPNAIYDKASRVCMSAIQQAANRMRLGHWFSEEPIVVGKKRLHRYRKDVATMLAPLILWFILVLVLFIISIITVKKLRTPLINDYLADLLSAGTARLIADALQLASSPSVEGVQSAMTQGNMAPRLNELQLVYTALLQGKNKDKQDLSFLTLGGTLFDKLKTQELFYRESGKCYVQYQPHRYCFKPGNKYYEVTHHAIDPMMLQFFDEVELMLAESPQVIFERGLGGSHIDYIYNVGWYALTGALNVAGQFYTNELNTGTTASLNALIASYVIMWAALAAYCYFLLLPYKRHLAHELRQVSEMLSHLPSDMNVEVHVTQAVGLEAPEGAAGVGKTDANASKTKPLGKGQSKA